MYQNLFKNVIWCITRSQDQCMLFVNFQQPHQTSDMQLQISPSKQSESFPLSSKRPPPRHSLPVLVTYLVSAKKCTGRKGDVQRNFKYRYNNTNTYTKKIYNQYDVRNGPPQREEDVLPVQ
jgi:hypothetical protein